MADYISLMEEINGIISQIDNPARSAESSIKGYFFQIDATIKRILECDNDSTRFYIEKVEDILEVGDFIKEHDKINVVQVKHHEKDTDNSDYYKPLLYFYLSYLIIKNANLEKHFLFILVKFDETKEQKYINNIIEEALISENKGYVSIIAKIRDLETEISETRTVLVGEFSSICNIVSYQSYNDLMEENIKLLKSMYVGDESKAKIAQDLYGKAWVHIKNGITKKDFYVTKSDLKNLFQESYEEIMDYILDINWKDFRDFLRGLSAQINRMDNTLIEASQNIKLMVGNKLDEIIYDCVLDIIQSIDDYGYDSKINEQDYRTVGEVFRSEIFNEVQSFILTNIEGSPSKQFYFLISVLPNYIVEQEFLKNPLNNFLKYSKDICSFIRRLSQIYYYRKYKKGDVKSLTELVHIDNNGIWLVKHNDFSFSLIGGDDFTSGGYSQINKICKKYYDFYGSNYPDILLYKVNKERRGKVSTIDITKVGENPNTTYYISRMQRKITERNRDLFVQCLNCLQEEDYESYSMCENIFCGKCEVG